MSTGYPKAAELRKERDALRAELSAVKEVLAELRPRNAALEENTLHVQAELERRQEELVGQCQRIAWLEERNVRLRNKLKGRQPAAGPTVPLADHEQHVKDMHVRHVAEVEALEKESRELRELLDREKARTRLLKEDLLAANNETGRLLDLMSVIRKAAKMAKA